MIIMESLLLSDGITFFRDSNSPDMYFVKDRKVHPFSEISIDDAQTLRDDLEKYPKKLKALEQANINDPLKQIEKYASCVFGLFHPNFDFFNGKRRSFLFTPCSTRKNGTCPLDMILCNKGKFTAEGVTITRRQLEVLSMIKKGLPDKEASSKLFISLDTYKCHKQNLLHKLCFKNSSGLSYFATINCI